MAHNFPRMRPSVNDAVVTLTLGPLTGSGIPPRWSFRVTDHTGSVVAQMSGPRILVTESLVRWLVELFGEASVPQDSA